MILLSLPPLAADTATWLSALGTLLAVLVALGVAAFGEQIKRRFWAPTIDVRPRVALFQIATDDATQHVPHAYLRLRVDVTSTRAAAEGVQIHLVESDPPATLGKQAVAHQGDFRIPLRWAFSHESSVDLPPGISRYVDVVEVNSLEPTLARLATVPAPPEGHFLSARPEPYVLQLAVVAKNVAPRSVALTITHRGDWDGTEASLEEHVSADVSNA